MAVTIGAEIRANRNELDRDMRRAGDVVERQLGRAAGRVQRRFATAFRDIGRLATLPVRGITGALRQVFSLRGALVGAVAGVGLQRLISQSSALEVQTRALANTTNKTTAQVTDYIKAVNDASSGLLDFQAAAEIANKALTFGIPQSAIARVIELSSAIQVATGESERAEEKIRGLLKAIATGESEPLKEAGIFIDQRQFAGLDFAAKQAAILRESLSQLEAMSRRLGVTGRETFFTFTGIFGNVKDIVGQLGLAVTQTERFKRAVQVVNNFTAGIADSLRDEGVAASLQKLGLRLLEIAGALAGDIGEAIAVGFAKGFASLVRLLGIDLSAVLGKEGAAALQEFTDNFVPARRLRIAGRNLAKTFAPRDARAGIDADSASELARAQQRIAELDKAVGGRGGAFREAVTAEREAAQKRGERVAPAELRRRAIDRLKAEREQLRRTAEVIENQRGEAVEVLDPEKDAAQRTAVQDRIERIERSLAGQGGRPFREALLEEKRAADEAGERVPPSVLRERANRRLQIERDRLRKSLGIGDPRFDPEAEGGGQGLDDVKKDLGINAGDGLGQQVGKAIVSGFLASSDALKKEVVAYFDEGVLSGIAKIKEELGPWLDQKIETVKTALLGLGSELIDKLKNAITGIDWIGIGAKIGRGVVDLIDGPRRKAVEETANVLAPVIRFLEQQLTPGGIARTAELDRIRREGITPGGKRLPGDESTTPESERLSPDEARERAKRFGEIFGDLLDPSVFEATGRDAKRATQRFDESARAIGEAFEQITGAALALREVATRAAGVIDRNVEAV